LFYDKGGTAEKRQKDAGNAVSTGIECHLEKTPSSAEEFLTSGENSEFNLD
jgi:hypothetical protein